MDNLDRSSIEEQRALDRALAVRKPTGPQSCGKCLNCFEPLPSEQRWCDADCREDWSKRNER